MKKPENQILVLFGASGDLTRRKLMPALYALYDQGVMPENFRIVGVGRTAWDSERFLEEMSGSLCRFADEHHLNEKKLQGFLPHLAYYSLDSNNPSEFNGLRSYLEQLCVDINSHHVLYYLSLMPSAFGKVASALGQAGLSRSEKGFRRLVVEKPFGYDVISAHELNHELHRWFDEDQIYRIDHYLGKETVQNLLVMRFSNGIFEPLWNRHFVSHVEISAVENLGVEGRSSYYEGAGALRDMFQNHLLHMLSFIAMEPPSSMHPDVIRNETLKVLQSLRPIPEEFVAQRVVRGQYIRSIVKGEALPGYREEVGVNPSSRTETFVALKVFIDNWRWGGVPFYFRTGKRLPTRVTEVVIHFKNTPHTLFQDTEQCSHCNQLIIRIQPDEGFLLHFGMKEPGAGFRVKPVNMDFHYKDLADIHLPSAYERLLLDAMNGDSTLYTRADSVEAAWSFVDPILKAWEKQPNQSLHGYPCGSWGPTQAETLITEGKEGWRYPCRNLSDNNEYCEL